MEIDELTGTVLVAILCAGTIVTATADNKYHVHHDRVRYDPMMFASMVGDTNLEHNAEAQKWAVPGPPFCAYT